MSLRCQTYGFCWVHYKRFHLYDGAEAKTCSGHFGRQGLLSLLCA